MKNSIQNPEKGIALYYQVENSIREKIENGEYPYQELLPSENTMVDIYSSSRNTIRRAVLELAEQAMKAAGIAAPTHSPIRGGTDGSVLTYMGLPCPNLPSAGHNAHGRFEYAPVESLKTGVRIIRELLSPALVESVILKKKG